MKPDEPSSESPVAPSKWAWIVPNFTVFVASMCIMVVELVAGRLIARHVGNSLYTWTSVIGVVLAGISAGNYLGGRIADRYPPRHSLAVLFLVSSVLCVPIPLLNDIFGNWEVLQSQGWGARIAAHVFLVFFLPAFVMGTISPVAAKLALEHSRHTGRTVGSIYSWGAAGSIVGTFLTGYFLIAWMGTVAVLLSVAAVMLAMAVFFGAKRILAYVWAMALVAAFVTTFGQWGWARTTGPSFAFREPPDMWVYSKESQYSLIRVQEGKKQLSRIRAMTLDALIHSYISLDDPDELHYDYEKIYAGVTELATESFAPERTRRMLFLGGGGFVFPGWVLRRWPNSYVQVAEIDPEVTRAAYEAFELKENPALNIFHLDARNHVDDLLARLNQGDSVGRFDVVYADAFNHYSPPYHLTTYEFNEKLRQLMSPQGILLYNVIDLYRSGRFLGAMVNTLNGSFPHVYVICTCLGGPRDKDPRDTFVLVASMRPLPLEERRGGLMYWSSLLTPRELETLRRRSNNLVLTDDYAPVDHLLQPVITTMD